MPPDVREWLQEGHLAWFVIDAVGEMDLEAFYGAYRHDGRSRPAYDPAMMVALLLYAYSRGLRSSRVIERACEQDVAFRVLAAQQRPDHATVARFIERHQEAIAGLFGEPSSMITLPASSRSFRGSHPHGGGPPKTERPESLHRNDRSTITSPTTTTRSRTQISPGIHGAIPNPTTHNRSPPALTRARVQISASADSDGLVVPGPLAHVRSVDLIVCCSLDGRREGLRRSRPSRTRAPRRPAGH